MIYEIGCFKCGEHTSQDVNESTTEVKCSHCGYISSAFSLVVDDIAYKNELISNLKSELKAEREAVDFYAELNNWDYSNGDIDGSVITGSDEEKWEIGERDIKPVGGKIARATQKKRKVVIND